MKAMSKSSLLAGGVITVLASAIVAHGDVVVGDTLNITFNSVSPARAVTWTFDDGTDVESRTTSAGVLNWSDGYRTFCIQLDENINSGSSVPFAVVDPSDLPDQPPLPGPLGTARSAVMQDLYARNYDFVMGQTGSLARDWAAAFQIMVWEISHELSADTTDASTVLADLAIGSGQASFDSSTDVLGFAQSMLDGLGGGVGDFEGYSRLLGLTNENKQDQLVVVPGVGGLAGLMGVVAVRRRRSRD